MTPAERIRADILLRSGVPLGIVERLIRWQRLHPNKHIGKAGSLLIASLAHRRAEVEKETAS